MTVTASGRRSSPEQISPKAEDPNQSNDVMAGITRIARNLPGLIANAFAGLLGGVFVWLCLAVLLIAVSALILLDASPFEAAVTIGGILLAAAGLGWTCYKLGEERAQRLGGILASLIVFGPIIGVAVWLWWSWEVPDIWHRPLAAMTLGDIGQNVLKLVVAYVGASFISAVVRSLLSKLRKN